MSRYADVAREIVGEDPPPLSDWQRERLRALFAPVVADLARQRTGETVREDAA